MDVKNFFTMLLSKNSPAIQEVIFVSSSLPPTLKPSTHRISELPSLRYGPVGSKTTMTGPLIVTSRDELGNLYEKGGGRRKKSVDRIFGRRKKYEENEGLLLKPERRVRFTLPPPDVATYTDAADVAFDGSHDADVNKPRYHSFLPLKTFSSKSNIVFRPVKSQNVEVSEKRENPTKNYVKGRRNCVDKTSRSFFERTWKSTLLERSKKDVKPRANIGKDSCENCVLKTNFDFSESKKYPPLQNTEVSFQKYPDFVGEKYDFSKQISNFKRTAVFQEKVKVEVPVPVAFSPGVRNRVHPTGRYVRGTLSPTQNTAPTAPPCPPVGQILLKAAQNGKEDVLENHLRRGLAAGVREEDLNAVDCSGRTVLSYIASNGSIDLLEIILQIPGLDPNKPDNEGNTPLHFAAQAGQIECLNCLLSRCRGVDIDARNNLGFTPLMKAALQGRNKCAKLLLFAASAGREESNWQQCNPKNTFISISQTNSSNGKGYKKDIGANPTLRDNGRGFRADQWARFCGRYVCADVIEKHARQRLLERSTSYGSWGLEHEMGATVVNGKVIPVPPVSSPPSNGLKSKLRKVFRTSSGPSSDHYSSARLITQLTSAALCASSPVLPGTASVPSVVKSLIRPLTVPRLQITLVNGNGDFPIQDDDDDLEEPLEKTVPSNGTTKVGNGTAVKVGNGTATNHVPNATHPENPVTSVVKPGRTKKKK